MGIVAIIVLIIVLFILAFAGLIWHHLFFRDAFTPPSDAANVQTKIFQGIPFLTEHDLPYPAGIQSTDRQAISLDGPWGFRLEGISKTTPVNVPSCFNTADSPLRDYQGAVWYEREFSPPAWAKGSLVRLAFLGSFYRTEVWLDEQLLGMHEGGYLPFYFDISNFVSPGEVHRLKVRVDNRIDTTSLPPRLFQGHNLGWYPYGGLHRSVQVEICPPQYCFKLRADTDLIPDKGLVHVSALFHRPGTSKQPLQTAALRLLADNKQILADADIPIHWDENGQFGAVTHTFTISMPQLWEPNAPHLYRLEIQTEYECCETTFGFRSIRAQDGKLILNDKPIILKGVCRHQEDREAGLAQALASVAHELNTIQNLNANFVRLAHYPHSAETLDLCDQLGLCAWTEIPLYQAGLGLIRFLFDKTKRDTGKSWRSLPGIFWNTNALENHTLLLKARDELLKLIERDSNHPSILFWGLGNECWTLHPSGAKALAWLREQAEAFDTRRLFVYSAFALPVLGPRYERAFDATDVACLNEYFGWYYGKVHETGVYLESLARRYPHKPLLVTETGADAVRGQHTTDVPPARGYSEEYQAWLLEEQWRQMRQVHTFAGLSIWVLKDFLCPEYREDNPVPFYNLKGLLDRDGQHKAAFERVKTLYAEDESQHQGA